jgi:hypothetical protein
MAVLSQPLKECASVQEVPAAVEDRLPDLAQRIDPLDDSEMTALLELFQLLDAWDQKKEPDEP